MENIIKVSGLGFEMEFDLRDIINSGIDKFCDSEDLDTEFCYLYPDRHSYINKKNNLKFLKTLRELNSLGSIRNWNSFFISIINDNSTVVRCSSISGILKFLTREELIQCGIDYSSSLSDINSIDLKMCTNRPGILEVSQAIQVYTLLDTKFGHLVDKRTVDPESSVQYWYTVHNVPYWYTGFNIFMCMQMCINLYVAKHLNLPVKKAQGSYMYCDKAQGRFSSTYSVVLEFNGVKSIQKVTVVSDNLI